MIEERPLMTAVHFGMFLQVNPSDGLSWPSISFIVLIVALVLVTIILWRRYRSRQNLMRRISELEALSLAGRAIVESQQDIDALAELIALESGLVIDNSTFQVGIFENNLYHILYWQIHGEKQEPQTFDLTENPGMVGWVRETKQPLLVNDFKEEFELLPAKPRYFSETAPRSAIFLPLLSGDKVEGVLAAQHPDPHRFTTEDLRRLMIIANQAGAAIANAQLFAQVEEQAWQTTAQLQIAQAISRNSMMERLIPAATRLTAMLLGSPFCGVLLWDKEHEVYVWRGGFAEGHQELDDIESQRLAVGTWAPLDAVHVGHESLTTGRIPHWLRPYLPSTSYQLLLQPLQSATSQVGVMLLAREDGENGRRPTQNELLANISNQLGQAIENENLRTAQQEEAWVNTALLQVAESVNTLTDLQEILGTIVRLIPMLVGVETALILIWDEVQQRFRVGPSFGMSEMGVGLLETLALDRKELNRMTTHADEPHQWVSYFRIEVKDWLRKSLTTPSAFAFPLRARGQLVGVLIIGTREEVFSTRRLNILNGIAQQAATAVVNNQLYQESAERSRLEQELNVAREIQSSLIPAGNPHIPNCSIASYWEAARQVSGDFYDFLQLNDHQWGIVVADVADKGVPAAIFMALSRTILRAVAFNRTDPADTLMRVNQIIDKDTQSDLFVTLFYAVWDCETNRLTYANGGHNPPILIKANGTHHLLRGRGIALGVLPDVEIDSNSVPIGQGDMIVFYTDGVTEAMNEDFDEFGLSRLVLTAKQARHRDAYHVRQSIQTAIGEHVGTTPQSDDITLVIMKRQQ